MDLPHSIFGSRTWTNASGKPVVLQEITPLPHSEILNQRFKFGDSERKPLHSQWTWKQKEVAEVRRQVRTRM